MRLLLQGHTALDAHVVSMKSARDYASAMEDYFGGYEDDDMEIIQLLCDAGAEQGLVKGLTLPRTAHVLGAGSVPACTTGQPMGGLCPL